jgi:hypothetical protein
MLEDIKKYIASVMGFRVENILYIYIFFKPRIIGKHKKDIRGHWKGPPNFIIKVVKNIKKDIMGVKHISVLIGENQIS